MLRIAVLGTGRIGVMHAELVAHRLPGAELVGVYDVAADAAAAVADRLGCSRYRSVEEAMGDPGVDAVAICSSTDTHADLIAAAAQAGKAIFCEKPISLDLGEVDLALAAVDAGGVPMQIGFNRRFDPSHAAVAAAVADGSIGEIEIVRITSRDPEPPPPSYIGPSGGIFLDMTIHDFDMARFVTDSEIVSVHAVGAVRVDPDIGRAGDLDTAVITLVHANGAFSTIDNSRRAVYGYDQRVEAFGSKGMVASGNHLVANAVRHDASGSHGTPPPYFFIDRYTDSYLAEWEAFIDAVLNDTPPPVDGRDARAPLVVGLAAWKSVRSGRTVRCDEIG